jgi:hypothetical protein
MVSNFSAEEVVTVLKVRIDFVGSLLSTVIIQRKKWGTTISHFLLLEA